MWPGYQMSAGLQPGSARWRRASGSRGGGGIWCSFASSRPSSSKIPGFSTPPDAASSLRVEDVSKSFTTPEGGNTGHTRWHSNALFINDNVATQTYSVPTTGTSTTYEYDELDRVIAQHNPDGGDIEFVGIDAQGVVQIRFHGACHGCPSSSMTLHDGIQRNLRERVPEVTRVIAVP